jgi:hypothetical protein
MVSPDEREAMIQELLERTTLPREYAEEIVAISLGESDGDIVPTHPLSQEEWRRMGRGITAEEALERMRAKRPAPVAGNG